MSARGVEGGCDGIACAELSERCTKSEIETSTPARGLHRGAILDHERAAAGAGERANSVKHALDFECGRTDLHAGAEMDATVDYGAGWGSGSDHAGDA